jgi:phage gpG-like protein
MSSFTIDTSELTKFKVTIDKYSSKAYSGAREAVRKSTLNIEKYAKSNLTKNGSVDTGLLRNSINSNIDSLRGTVSTNTKYAKIVEEGSKPHIIKPKKKKFLYWKGASHPVKEVKHPGSKAKPYMIPAFEKEIPNFIKELSNALDMD